MLKRGFCRSVYTCTGNLLYLNSNFCVYGELFQCNKHYFQNIRRNIVLYSIGRKGSEILFCKQYLCLLMSQGLQIMRITNSENQEEFSSLWVFRDFGVIRIWEGLCPVLKYMNLCLQIQ